MIKICSAIFVLLTLSIFIGGNLACAQPGPVRTKPLNGILLSTPGLPRGTQVTVRIFLDYDSTWMPQGIAGLVATLDTDNDARFFTQLPIYNNNKIHIFRLAYRNCNGNDVDLRLFANPGANSFFVYPFYCFNSPPPCSPEFTVQADTLANPTGTIITCLPKRQSLDLDSCYGANRHIRWTVDHEVLDTTNFALIKQFDTPGSKRICLNITDINTGQTYQFCRTVVIQNRCNLPVRFNHAAADSLYQFAVSANVPPQVPLFWNLGDGSFQEGQQIQHVYRYPGRYNVCAEAVFSSQCRISWCDTIEVRPRQGHFAVSVVVQGVSPDFSQGQCAIDSVVLEAFSFTQGNKNAYSTSQNPARNCRFNLSLPIGSYLLKATPVGQSMLRYVPTYSYNTLNWLQADVIQGPGEKIINLIPRRFSPSSRDSGIVRGFVLGIGNMVNYIDPETGEQHQIPFDATNAILVLGDSNNNMLDVRSLNADGIFEINQLANGRYWLTLDHPMVAPASVRFQVNQWGLSPMLQFLVEEQGLSVVSHLRKSIERQIQVFPNPTRTWINVSLEQELEKVTISDLSGKIHMESDSKKIDVSSLPTGYYLLFIRAKGGQVFSTRLTKN